MAEPRRQVMREEHSVRARAPVQAVWQELATIDLILAHIEQVRQSVIDDSGQSAKIRARLAWGPFGWTLNGNARAVEAAPPERLVFEIELPTMGVGHTGTLELVAAADDETNLRFLAEFRLGRLARGFRTVVDDGIEGFTRGLVEGIAAMAERHWQAHERLQNRNQGGEQQ